MKKVNKIIMIILFLIFCVMAVLVHYGLTDTPNLRQSLFANSSFLLVNLRKAKQYLFSVSLRYCTALHSLTIAGYSMLHFYLNTFLICFQNKFYITFFP